MDIKVSLRKEMYEISFIQEYKLRRIYQFLSLLLIIATQWSLSSEHQLYLIGVFGIGHGINNHILSFFLGKPANHHN